MNSMKLVACVAAFGIAGTPIAQARTINCASAAEVSAIQISAMQQELTDAALACGAGAVANFNRFQTVFGPELRKSDALMLKMFKRMNGSRAGDAAYDAYKTRAIAHAEQRRTKPGAQCAGDIVLGIVADHDRIGCRAVHIGKRRKKEIR